MTNDQLFSIAVPLLLGNVMGFAIRCSKASKCHKNQ